MRTLLCFLVVFVPTCASAQELPNPKPGKVREILASNVGTWDCEVKMFLQGPGEPPLESKGVEVNKLVSSDLYLQTSFTCQLGDPKFEGHALTGYDPRSKKYIGTWVDNLSTIPMQLKGEYDERSITYTVRSTVVGETGHEVQQKQITVWTDSAQKKVETYWIIEQGEKRVDAKVMAMTATKRD